MGEERLLAPLATFGEGRQLHAPDHRPVAVVETDKLVDVVDKEHRSPDRDDGADGPFKRGPDPGPVGEVELGGHARDVAHVDGITDHHRIGGDIGQGRGCPPLAPAGDDGGPAPQAALPERRQNLARGEREDREFIGDGRSAAAREAGRGVGAVDRPAHAPGVHLDRPGAAVPPDHVDEIAIDGRGRAPHRVEILSPDLGPGGRVECDKLSEPRGHEDPGSVSGETAARGIAARFETGGQVLRPEDRARSRNGGDLRAGIEREDAAAGHHRVGGDPGPAAVAFADIHREGQGQRDWQGGMRGVVVRPAGAVRPVGVGPRRRQRDRACLVRRGVERGADRLALTGQDHLATTAAGGQHRRTGKRRPQTQPFRSRHARPPARPVGHSVAPAGRSSSSPRATIMFSARWRKPSVTSASTRMARRSARAASRSPASSRA